MRDSRHTNAASSTAPRPSRPSAGARVIASGPDVTDAPEPYLRAGAELTLAGEGLATLMEVIPRFDSPPDTDLIQGLSGAATLVNDRVMKVNGARILPSATQQAEPAAWDLVDMDRYRRVWMDAHGYFSLNMAASRGCSFRCNWCAKPIWGNQYLQRSAASVAKEMLYLKAAFKPDHIWFADDIFGFRIDWVHEFAATLTAGGGGIPFTIQTRADLLSDRMSAALAAAGCQEAWLGAESGSQRVLDAMASGYSTESMCKSGLNVPPPCAQFPQDTLLGQDMKTVNLSSVGSGAGGIIASLPDVTRWVRALFSDTLLPPKQKAELFALVSTTSGKPIDAASPADPGGFSLGVSQDWSPFLGTPVWRYMGETLSTFVSWVRRPGDELVVVLAENATSDPTKVQLESSLYRSVIGILDPQSVLKDREPAHSSA